MKTVTYEKLAALVPPEAVQKIFSAMDIERRLLTGPGLELQTLISIAK